jgi:hypothetical protein
VGPGEDIVIGAGVALEGAGAEVSIGDAEEAAAAVVERVELGIADERHVVRRELIDGVQANFIEHAAEVDETADFRIATAETWDVRHARG